MALQLSGIFDEHMVYFCMVIYSYLVRTKQIYALIIFQIEIIQRVEGPIILTLLTISLVVQIYKGPLSEGKPVACSRDLCHLLMMNFIPVKEYTMMQQRFSVNIPSLA